MAKKPRLSDLAGGETVGHYPTVCTPDEMVKAVKDAHGIAAVAATMLDCTRRTVMTYVNRYPEVEAAYKEAREENVDLAENKQLVALNKGQRWAIENWLFHSKEGRERGWLRRAEQGQDLNLMNAIQIIIPDNARDGSEEIATVDVTQEDDDGNVRLYTYAVTPEEARNQKRLANLTPGGTPLGDDAAWLGIDDWVEEEEEETGNDAT